MSSQLTPILPPRRTSIAAEEKLPAPSGSAGATGTLKTLWSVSLCTCTMALGLFAGQLAEHASVQVAFWGRLALLLFSGLWIGLLTTALTGAGRRLLSRYKPLSPTSGLAATALAGYALFWAYLWQPLLGHALVLVCGIGALLWLVSPSGAPGRALWCDAHWRVTLLTTGALGLFYFGLLHLWPHEGEWNWLAAHRFAHELPMDNVLPQLLAERLLTGHPLEPFVGDWLSSDRPPLQAAWMLLAGPLSLLGHGGARFEALGQAFGLWFQLLWWPALLAFFQTLGFSLRKSVFTALPLALTAFLMTNSLYAWPKLAAASFVLAAWLELHAQRKTGNGGRAALGGWVRAGICLALACLCHGGAAFALLGLALPLALIEWPFGRASLLKMGALLAVLFLTVAPWLDYQRFCAPPGNRLVKWHLAGAPAIDGRSTNQALREAYSGLSAEKWWDGRKKNISILFEGDWRNLAFLSETNLGKRRNDDFFLLFRSMGWWAAGLAAVVPVVLLPRNSRSAAGVHTAMSVLGWITLTLLCWLILMYEPYSTVIHQGSHLPPLLLLALSAWALRRLHVLVFATVAGLSLWYTVDTYILHAPKDFPMQPSAAAAGLACLAALALICVPLRVKAHGIRK